MLPSCHPVRRGCETLFALTSDTIVALTAPSPAHGGLSQNRSPVETRNTYRVHLDFEVVCAGQGCSREYLDKKVVQFGM